MNKEAIRVLLKSPKWIPGIENNELVRVAYTVPIQFILGEANNTKSVDKTAEKWINTLTGKSTGKGTVTPLYIVDGKELKANADGSLPTIPADDIASVEVLKEELAKKLYGSKAKNGVVVVVTKKHK
jgi:hypothetical protein